MSTREGRSLKEIMASDVMKPGVATVSPELTLATFQEFLVGEEISGAPVVDDNGALQGIASKTDIVRFLTTDPTIVSEEVMNGVVVKEIMTEDVVTVDVSESISDVARKMVDLNVHRVVVVSDESIRGILTTFDLLELLVDQG
jgi:CBS domain-containing protein